MNITACEPVSDFKCLRRYWTRSHRYSIHLYRSRATSTIATSPFFSPSNPLASSLTSVLSPYLYLPSSFIRRNSLLSSSKSIPADASGRTSACVPTYSSTLFLHLDRHPRRAREPSTPASRPYSRLGQPRPDLTGWNRAPASRCASFLRKLCIPTSPLFYSLFPWFTLRAVPRCPLNPRHPRHSVPFESMRAFIEDSFFTAVCWPCDSRRAIANISSKEQSISSFLRPKF